MGELGQARGISLAGLALALHVQGRRSQTVHVLHLCGPVLSGGGTYLFTCIFEIDGQGANEDADMRVGNLQLIEYPNVADFTRTLTGIAQTGTFFIKQKYRDATNYYIRLEFVKLV